MLHYYYYYYDVDAECGRPGTKNKAIEENFGCFRFGNALGSADFINADIHAN